MKRPAGAAALARNGGKLFPSKVFGLADLAAYSSRAALQRAFCLHTPIANQPAHLLLGMAF
jgi:hypothetical protein